MIIFLLQSTPDILIGDIYVIPRPPRPLCTTAVHILADPSILSVSLKTVARALRDELKSLLMALTVIYETRGLKGGHRGIDSSSPQSLTYRFNHTNRYNACSGSDNAQYGKVSVYRLNKLSYMFSDDWTGRMWDNDSPASACCIQHTEF